MMQFKSSNSPGNPRPLHYQSILAVTRAGSPERLPRYKIEGVNAISLMVYFTTLFGFNHRQKLYSTQSKLRKLSYLNGKRSLYATEWT